MSDQTKQNCPQCGAALPANAPSGLCPRCLMALNLKTETIFTDETPAIQPPLPPSEIAPHFPQLEILECLGRGGMGVVYKVRQKTLNRFAALKLLAPERVHDAKFSERFAREAQALAAMNHPNIVTIYDFGQAGGFYYLLMEFVDGMNLRQLLRTHKFTPEEALTIVPPLCDALQFAHDRGIVHRDIKPENLLLAKDGRVKVADFGIAKMLGAANGGESAGISAATDNTTKTALGTPGYSAPEQKTDPQRVDSRADIYSLGVVFYEMLTGELPGKLIEAPSRKVHIDVRLDEVVLRALEKTPELRFQQASDVKTSVETILADAEKSKARSQAPTPVLTSRSGSRFLFVADVGLAGLAVLGGWAAKEMGIFFNALFVFIILLALVRVVLVLKHLVCGTIEFGFWKRPLAAEFRPYWGQILNVWIFWLLAGSVLGLCMMPVQFPPSVYSALHATYWGGIVILLLLALLPGRRIYWAMNLALAIGSIFMATQIIQIHLPAPRAAGVVLAAPFRGEWVVFNGGRSTLLNNNYGSESTRYALDLERVVNKQECTGGENKLASYPSWNEQLYAPADGTVVNVINDLEDNEVGATDDENPAGNRVVIDMGNGRFVTMDYLRKGSVLVSTGEVVHVGQPIARGGNSGTSGHPMLNIQVQTQPDEFAPGIKTFPIFFRDVTCVRSRQTRTDAPFFVRRNDLVITQPATGLNNGKLAWNASAGVWTNWNNEQKIGGFFAAAATTNEIVAVGIGGQIATRKGATGAWRVQTFAGHPSFRAIIYAGGQYVAAREGGSIMTSPDGLAWTPHASSTTNNLLGLYWDGHQYFAVGDRGTILTSPDGIDWSKQPSGSTINLTGLSYSGSRYVVVGNDGLLISDDGRAWRQPVNWIETARVPLQACTWTGEEFLACGLGLDKFPTIYTSPDGNFWTLRDTTITASLRSAITVNGVSYVCGDNVIEESHDGGTTWMNTFPKMDHNELFMGLASNGQSLIAVGFSHDAWVRPLAEQAK